MRFKLAVLLAAVALFAAAPVFAGNITFNFGDCTSITSPVITSSNCPNADLGSATATYTEGSYNITATGYKGSNTRNLYVKNGSASETGLGLNNTSNNEINSGQAIYLDMSDLLSQGISSATIGLGSLQSNEFGTICESAAVGTVGTVNCQTIGESGSTAINSTTVNFTSTDPVLSFTVPSGKGSSTQNFLILGSVSATTTPEPATLVLFGTALIGLGLISKRFRSVKA